MYNRMVASGVLAGLMLVMLAGCEATAKSDLAEPTWQPTATYEKAFAQPRTTSVIEPRQWPESQAAYEPCRVTHFGSYYDDPFVTNGDGDSAYGWTGMDWLARVYSPARMAVNTVAVPVSMIKEPPGVLPTTDLDQANEIEPEHIVE